VTTRDNWQKSSFSGSGDGNNCVELAAISPHQVGLRESHTPGTILTTTHAPITQLLRAITSGRFRT
jgi:hypothetical protein